MAESKNKTQGFNGRIRGAGVTFYQREGKTFARVSTRSVKNKQSLAQFKVRVCCGSFFGCRGGVCGQA